MHEKVRINFSFEGGSKDATKTGDNVGKESFVL